SAKGDWFPGKISQLASIGSPAQVVLVEHTIGVRRRDGTYRRRWELDGVPPCRRRKIRRVRPAAGARASTLPGVRRGRPSSAACARRLERCTAWKTWG